MSEHHQDATRESEPVVQTPSAPPPRLIWLLLLLGVAAGLLAWGLHLGRPQRMWSVAQERAQQVIAARRETVADSGRASIEPVPQPTISAPVEPRGVLDVDVDRTERLAVEPVAVKAAPLTVPIPEGTLIAMEPARPPPPARAPSSTAQSPTRNIPPEMALIQALRAGQLQPATHADFNLWRLRYMSVNGVTLDKTLDDMAAVNAYVIRQDFEFPEGLHGAHSALFLLKPDVPFPRGDPGHSMLLDMSTGACMGFSCRSLRH